jgi:aryl-alcohol dehydrogenase-like predicted oxidoreductase
MALGTWFTFGNRVAQNTATAMVRRALERGVNFFETADVYALGKAETLLGEALSGVPRKDYVLATKCFFPTGDGPNDKGLSRKHIHESCHASLKRLQADYVDLFQCHRYDPETPVDETVRALEDLCRQGRVLYWGVSMWDAVQIEEGLEAARDIGARPPISNQPCYNLLERKIEADLVPACAKHGLGILPYSPLAQGVLTGKYVGGTYADGTRADSERARGMMGRFLAPDASERVERFAEVAADAGTTPAKLALAWLMARPQVSSVLVGASGVAQLDENLDAADFELKPDVAAALEEIFPAG